MALPFILKTNLWFMANCSPHAAIRVVMVSDQKLKVVMQKSYKPPIKPLITSNFA